MDQIPRERRKEFLGTLVHGIKGTKESSWVEELITLPQPSYIQRGGKGERKGERERKEKGKEQERREESGRERKRKT